MFRFDHVRAFPSVLLAGLFLLPVGSSHADDVKSQIKSLLKERDKVQKDLVEAIVVNWRTRPDINALMQAEKTALEVGLELYEKPEERIKSLKEHLKVAEELEAKATAAFKAGSTDQGYSLAAKSFLLDVKIRLLREEAKATKSLLKERYEVQKDLVKVILLNWVRRPDINALMQAEKTALEVGLELYEKPEERIKFLKEQLKVAEELEAKASAGFEAGNHGKNVPLAAKSFLLDVKIRQLREEAKAKKGK